MSPRIFIVVLSFVAAHLIPLSVVQADSPPSCVPADACTGNTGKVGPGVCIGAEACRDNSGGVSKGGCHGVSACQENDGRVGPGACIGAEACRENSGGVSKGSCQGISACQENDGPVGENACVGESACQGNAGAISKLSCQGFRACLFRSGPVAQGSCVGEDACANSGAGAIGKGACHGDRACANNAGPIAKGTCNGPLNAATGKGVCEPDPAPCQVIGHQLVDIRRDSPARLRESAMGNLVADAMRARYPGVDAALTNSGGLREDLIHARITCGEIVGEITWGEVFAILPFGNRTVIETLTGAQLTDALLNGFSPVCNTAIATGRFPQVSGLKLEFHCNGVTALVDTIWTAPSGPAGPLTPLGPADTVRLVTNDFMFGGGDGYTVLAAGTNVLLTGDLLLDVLVADIVDRSTPPNPGVSAAVEGRIVQQ